MNKEIQLNTISSYWNSKPKGMPIACAKSDKLLPELRQLLDDFGTVSKLGITRDKDRQRLTMGDTEIKLVRAVDAIDWLKKGSCFFALTSLDAICEWATNAGYKKYQAFSKDYEISMLGTNRCTVEVACTRYSRYGSCLVDAFKQKGLAGLDEIARLNNLVIGSDVPGLARYFFSSFLVDDNFEGSIELLPQYNYSLIVAVVETGKSLDDSKWVRLSQINKEAVLLNSQTCIVRKRR